MEIEKPRISLARELARNIIKNMNIVNAPILIRDVVNKLKETKDLSVCPWNFGDNVDGLQSTEDDNSAIIGYNIDRHPHRQRFTVAHEIGHFLLGHNLDDDFKDENNSSIKEKEAHEFAAELLMPINIIKKDFKNNENLDYLSKKYWVSKEALCIRLIELRLIK